MAIVRGPNAYISPAWYETKREHGRVVPTWNYITAHVHGRPASSTTTRPGSRPTSRRLSDRHEASREAPWSVDDAPVPYIEGQLKAIVGVELVIDRVEGKWKLSQNRSDADIAGNRGSRRPAKRASAAMRALDEADRLAREWHGYPDATTSSPRRPGSCEGPVGRRPRLALDDERSAGSRPGQSDGSHRCVSR